MEANLSTRMPEALGFAVVTLRMSDGSYSLVSITRHNSMRKRVDPPTQLS